MSDHFPVAECWLFLDHLFGRDLVMPIYQWIVPCPKNRAELIQWVDRWVDNPASFVDHIRIWDVSLVIDFSDVFSAQRNPKMKFFDEDLQWNMRNAINTERMFYECAEFKGGRGLKQWNVSNVTSMREMFEGCYKFNGNILEWNVSNATNMESMFYNCTSFNQDLSGWSASNATNMRWMFYNCASFNADLSTWNVSDNVTNINDMFVGCDLLESLPLWAQ